MLQRHLNQIQPSLRRAIRELVRGEIPWPLFLYGAVGTGKTAAALCLLDYTGGEYFTVETLAESLIAAQQGRLERGEAGNRYDLHTDDFWLLMARVPLVVLDELGTTGLVSDHRYNGVKRMVDERLGKPLVIVSNHRLSQIAEFFDNRVSSRIAGGTLVELDGPDRRWQPIPASDSRDA